jgi:uncharacterized protein YcbK (DUF882 family)
MARRPANLPKKYRPHWAKPWGWRARNSRGFRSWLDNHGYLSPNFTKREARCKDGTPVPKRLMKRARDHAFRLERVRHAIGDRPVAIISWYRHPAYNRRIGGATRSQHINAVATDHPKSWVNKIGKSRLLRIGNSIFRNGGMGVYPAGSMHFDSRGWRSRWTSV